MTDKIQKFLASLDAKTKARLKRKLIEIKSNPFGVPGIKKLKAWGHDAYRVRIGKIRIIYTVTKNEVTIIDIDYRGNIY